MSNATLAPWDRTKFEKLKASISDEAEVRARLVNWDADLVRNTKEISEAKHALNKATQARETKYRSLRPLLATESGESIKAHLGELFHLEDEILSANRLIREIGARGLSNHDRDNLVSRIAVIDRTREDMIDLSPFCRTIREQRSEIRAHAENGNAEKRILLKIDEAKRSHHDNKHELVEHYEALLERHNRKLAEMQANLAALLKGVFG